MVPGPQTSWVMRTSTSTQTFSPGSTRPFPACLARIFSVMVMPGMSAALLSYSGGNEPMSIAARANRFHVGCVQTEPSRYAQKHADLAIICMVTWITMTFASPFSAAAAAPAAGPPPTQPSADLPDPFLFTDGRRVKTPDDWTARARSC